MPSPFPGMDPFLEEHWRDVHHRLVTYACDQLQPKLPSPLRARLEERVFVESEFGEGRVVYPDVKVVETRGPARWAPRATGDERAAEPLVVHVEAEPSSQGFIQIVDSASGGRVVTIIEFLSPTNKLAGDGQRLYLEKQQESRASATNLVEIDLVRAGPRVLSIPTERIPPSHRTPYLVCVWRASSPLAFEVYRVPLQEPLPAIRVPLRESDRDVVLDLQPLVARSYEMGRYDDIDYRRAPRPPLEGPDAAWAEEMLRSKGLRG